VEAPRDTELRRPNLGESQEQFEERLLREGLKESDEATRKAREGILALRRLITRLKGQNVEVRRYERAFMHAKAYIFAPPPNVYGGRAKTRPGAAATRPLLLAVDLRVGVVAVFSAHVMIRPSKVSTRTRFVRSKLGRLLRRERHRLLLRSSSEDQVQENDHRERNAEQP
jgi:hypothetical protein